MVSRGRRRADRFSQALTFVEPGSRHLDIGGHDGSFSRAVLDRGFETSVLLEPFPNVPSELLDDERFELVRSDLESFETQERFDLITMLDVLEHVPDVERALGAVRNLLAPGGTLLLSVPHACSYEWLDPGNLVPYTVRSFRPQLFARRYPDFRHHRHFSYEDLRKLLWRRGFRLDEAVFNGTAFGVLMTYAGYALRSTDAAWYRRLKGQDYRRSWGRQSYHIMIRASLDGVRKPL